MKFKNSKFYKTLEYKEVNFLFGTYYFFTNFVISEINEGEDFDWEKAKLTIAEILNFYGKDSRIGFIINRVNKYSIDPQNWIKTKKNYDFMAASVIITYEESSRKAADLDKYFAKNKIKICQSLDEAITWIKDFNGLNN
jgi:hypothetical protein